MTPDELAALERQRRIAERREVRVEQRKPLPGQRSLFDGPARKRATGKARRDGDGPEGEG